MADLVIEVAVSSLAYDRDEKASLYARYGIREYWVLDAVGRKLEVHRGPEPMEGRTFGHGYADVRACEEVDRVSPLCRPDVSIAATELL
jgi:Uma2 family endonuclease